MLFEEEGEEKGPGTYCMIAYALSITQNLGDHIYVGYLPCILVFQCINHHTSHQEWIRERREYLTPLYLPIKALFVYKVHLHIFSTTIRQA